MNAKDAEIKRLRQWVADLQSGMYVNCVYCGHRYGPDPGTPVAMADVLRDHIARCPKHPLSIMADRAVYLVKLLHRMQRAVKMIGSLYGKDGISKFFELDAPWKDANRAITAGGDSVGTLGNDANIASLGTLGNLGCFRR